MYSVEATGKTIEKAIENALFELKASRDDVDIKILNEGGLFKKATVLVSISEDAREKYEKKKQTSLKEVDLKNELTEKKLDKEINKIETQKENVEVEDTYSNISEDSSTEETTNHDEQLIKKENKEIDPIAFLQGMFDILEKSVNITVNEDEKYFYINVEGEDLGDVIGHRGECLYAINRLLTTLNSQKNKKILLDIGNFREQRSESLTQLAKRTAEKVVKSGRYMKLLPMNPADRRVIHTTLQDDLRVTTLSKGKEPNRYVIIFPQNEN